MLAAHPGLAPQPADAPSAVSLQFQVFLKQINSSLVDSNMLVRCVTLSLDRFENQMDMKGADSRLLAGRVSGAGGGRRVLVFGLG